MQVPLNFAIELVIGGLAGWIASLIMQTDALHRVFLNVFAGIVGAALGDWILSPVIDIRNNGDDMISIASIFASLIGAIVLLAVVSLFWRGPRRPL
jgi:uncharacterized membrane protein YeaQ/YmgE (transglycosylase-associated protein family)